MSSYILSRGNRFYAAIESAYGMAAPITAGNRLVGQRLQAHQVTAPSTRRDKTGLRTYSASGVQGLRTTAFEFSTFLTSTGGAATPYLGNLLQGALGSAPELSSGLVVSAAPSAAEIQTTTAHGLTVGDAVSWSGELRFVVAVPSSSTLMLNAPLSNAIPANATLGNVAVYRLGTSLPSVSLYDYWDPTGAVCRVLPGAAINQVQLSVSGPEADVAFSGPAADLLDSVTFVSGTAGLNAFPQEPSLADFEYLPITTQMGQAWLGNSTAQFYTVMNAHIEINNNLQLRDRDMTVSLAQAITPGPREITVDFTLMAQDDAQTTQLYAIAKQRGTISVQLQIGTVAGQMVAVYVPSVTPELPLFDDTSERLEWQFTNCVARGAGNDEIFFAFG